MNERNGAIIGYYIRYGLLGSETLSKKTIRDTENLQVGTISLNISLDISLDIFPDIFHTISLKISLNIFLNLLCHNLSQTIISGLAPFSKYSVTVSPFTSVGPGPTSSKSVVATLEGGENVEVKVDCSSVKNRFEEYSFAC